jgi:hypothetical protein
VHVHRSIEPGVAQAPPLQVLCDRVVDLENLNPIAQIWTTQREGIEAGTHHDVLRHSTSDGNIQEVLVVARAAQNERRAGVGANGMGERRGTVTIHDEVGARPR